MAVGEDGQGADAVVGCGCFGAQPGERRSNLLQAHPDVQGVIAANDEMALGAVKALGAKAGTSVQVVGFDGTPDGLAAVKNGTLYASVAQQPSQLGRIAVDNALKAVQGKAVDPRTGGRRWHVATEARQSVEPVLVSDGLVHLGSGGGLYTLDAVSGAPKWRFATQGDIVGAPVAADGRIHFGSMDHCLYTVDASGGQLRWKLETGGEITGTPVVRDGVVFACSKDRCVYALDAAKGTGVAPKR